MLGGQADRPHLLLSDAKGDTMHPIQFQRGPAGVVEAVAAREAQPERTLPTSENDDLPVWAPSGTRCAGRGCFEAIECPMRR